MLLNPPLDGVAIYQTLEPTSDLIDGHPLLMQRQYLVSNPFGVAIHTILRLLTLTAIRFLP